MSDKVTNSAANLQLRRESVTATPHYHAAKKRKQKVQKITLLVDRSQASASYRPPPQTCDRRLIEIMDLTTLSRNERSSIAEFLPNLCKFCMSLQSTRMERKASRTSSRLGATRFDSNLTEIRYFRCLFLPLTNSRIQFNDCNICATGPLASPVPSCPIEKLSIGRTPERLLN